MGKETEKIQTNCEAIKRIKQLVMANTRRIDNNHHQLENIAYQTQCWNYAQSKELAGRLNQENYRLEELNYQLSQQENKLAEENKVLEDAITSRSFEEAVDQKWEYPQVYSFI